VRLGHTYSSTRSSEKVAYLQRKLIGSHASGVRLWSLTTSTALATPTAMAKPTASQMRMCRAFDFGSA
jgi:hypothetical protein